MYSFEPLVRDSQTQRVYLLAKKPHGWIVQMLFCRLNENVRTENNISLYIEVLKKMKKRSCITDDVINICLCLDLYIMKNIVNFSLNESDQLDIAHDRDLEDFFSTIADNVKHQAMIRVEKPLMKERGGIQDNLIDKTHNVCNYL